MCFDYEILWKEEQKKAVEKEKEVSRQQSDIEKAEERPIAA